jgi:DNA-damage-inducible protein J
MAQKTIKKAGATIVHLAKPGKTGGRKGASGAARTKKGGGAGRVRKADPVGRLLGANAAAKAAKTATMHVRVEHKLKVQAEAILGELGLTPSEAVRLFYTRVRAYGGLPFELRVPNAETRAALDAADAGVGLTRYGSVDEMFADLDS